MAFAEGRKAVADYLDALRAGNADAAKKLSGGVKGAYKKVWSLDPRSARLADTAAHGRGPVRA